MAPNNQNLFQKMVESVSEQVAQTHDAQIKKLLRAVSLPEDITIEELNAHGYKIIQEQGPMELTDDGDSQEFHYYLCSIVADEHARLTFGYKVTGQSSEKEVKKNAPKKTN